MTLLRYIERDAITEKPRIVFEAKSDVIPRVGDMVALPDAVYLVLQVMFDYEGGRDAWTLKQVHIKVQLT